jgi:hypothetical protein
MTKKPVPGWPTSEPHVATEEEQRSSRMAVWMLLITAAVVVLGYMLVNRMFGF